MNRSRNFCLLRIVWIWLCAVIGFYSVFVSTAVAEARPFSALQDMVVMRGPREDQGGHFGHVGVTGLFLRFHPGRVLKIEHVLPDTPATGLFEVGETVVGVNGIPLAGNNAFVVLGALLAKAEETDGKLVFTVHGDNAAQARDVAVQIPVLGSYSATWPLACEKSDQIVTRAAAYYANRRLYANGDHAEELGVGSMNDRGMGAALAALFLLSTGDDQYLLRVKQYVDQLAADVPNLGDHSWNNGYNGILVAEYYLRTGDAAALPVLQFYADNARDRQFFGVGWGHWGRGLNPRYVAGGLMNPAGAQIATTLLLAKECGIEVDTDTLLGALRHWYRFAGRGTVAYGDHRGEGCLGSNGKDGMSAAMMQVASGAQGNVEIYEKARDLLSKSTLFSYPVMVGGHGDSGRGDGIWRGIASSYSLATTPEYYHALQNNLRWWFALARRPGGGFGMPMNMRFDDAGSGAGLGLAYTAPRRTLRITGAPPSEHAHPFTLPERIWGREADRAFHRITYAAPYQDAGEEEPPHVLFRQLGSAYTQPEADFAEIHDRLLRHVRHPSFMVRTQAAKALLRLAAFEDLAGLLDDPDPRVRRAGLDGLTDYNYWHFIGRNPARSEQISPAMIESIRRILQDPEESLFVVDGALLALSLASPDVIYESLALIMPWTEHTEWWLRQSSYAALNGIAQKTEFLPEVLPIMVSMYTGEPRTQARDFMRARVAQVLRRHPSDTVVGAKALAGLLHSIAHTTIRPEPHLREGRHYVLQAAIAAMQHSPESAAEIAEVFYRRFGEVEQNEIEDVTNRLLALVGDRRLSDDARSALVEKLSGSYRRAFLRMLEERPNDAPLDTILGLAQLERPEAGWRLVGGVDPAERVWRFTSFDPAPADRVPAHINRRFRVGAVPEELEGWYEPAFDASGWSVGHAPIGKGEFRGRGHHGRTIDSRSVWGDGELVVMRSTIEIEDPSSYDFFRLRVLANNGYRVLLNGHEIHRYGWWNNTPEYTMIRIPPHRARHFQAGPNVIAVFANIAYEQGEQVGQIDVFVEGLTKSDLLGTANGVDATTAMP